MAVTGLDRGGRVTLWEGRSEQLFGYGRREALGRPFSALVPIPPQYRAAFEPASHAHGDASTRLVTCRVDGGNGAAETIIWWVYPLAEPDDLRVLAFAVEASRLHDGPPGLAGDGDHLAGSRHGAGDDHLAGDHHWAGDGDYPAERSQPPGNHQLAGARHLPGPADAADDDPQRLQVISVTAAVLPVASAETVLLTRQLSDALAGISASRRAVVARQVLAQGYPAAQLAMTARVPIGATQGALTQKAMIEHATARDRLAFLSEVGARLGARLDPVQTARELATAFVPRFADVAAVYVLEELLRSGKESPLPPGRPVVLRRLAMEHGAELQGLSGVLPAGADVRFPVGTPMRTVLDTGEALYVARISHAEAENICAHVANPGLRPFIEGCGMLLVPLVARGSVLGCFMLLYAPGRAPVADLDIMTAGKLAGRAALAIDNAILYLQEARIAQALQERMLPGDLPPLTGVEVSYRYLPASRNAQVGGDWFDAIPLSGGATALLVGDVMGHGWQSAAIMGQLRTAVQTLTSLEMPPGVLLARLDEVARRLGDDCLATCLYLTYDPRSRRCLLANAGHLPPILLDPEGNSRLLDLPVGPPIGVGGLPFETIEITIADGSQLVLCTDGLVEVRGQDIGLGLTGLCERLAGPARSPDELCIEVIRALGTDNRDDGIALLAARFTGTAAVAALAAPDLPVPAGAVPTPDPSSGLRAATRCLPADPRSVAQARQFTRAMLGQWNLTAVVPTVELLVSELVTNAVMHTTGPISIRLLLQTDIRCEVIDSSRTLPVRAEADLLDEQGRGLLLVDELARRWGTQTRPGGKLVWFEHPCAAS